MGSELRCAGESRGMQMCERRFEAMGHAVALKELDKWSHLVPELAVTLAQKQAAPLVKVVRIERKACEAQRRVEAFDSDISRAC